MNIDSFFAHHGIRENPFGAEEARHDPVFGRLAPRAQKSHPEFDKVLGRIERPHASVVFGEKGAGKTALRLLIGKAVAQHNEGHPRERALLVAYDDLNPVLDRFARHRHTPGAPDLLLKRFRLQDHQDAILSLATTKLLDAMLGVRGEEEAMQLPADFEERLRSMPRHLRADAGMLAALYDQPRTGNVPGRWRAICRRLRLGWRLPFSLVKASAILLSVVALGLFLAPMVATWLKIEEVHVPHWVMPAAGVTAATAGLLWLVWLWRHLGLWIFTRRILSEAPTLDRTPKQLGRMIRRLPARGAGQPWPLPGGDSTNARYELTQKLLAILRQLDHVGVLVVVDRVDEPTMVAGQPERMRSLVWPLFDAKFLQQQGVGMKLLLPVELRYLVHKETAEFFQEARLDKQSLVDRLSWSGATLYDLCTDRLRACHNDQNAGIALTDLFAEDVSRATLVEALGQMHQPRDAFKLLYSVIREHCQLVPEEEAQYRIPRLTLETIRREQSQRIQDLQRGLSPA